MGNQIGIDHAHHISGEEFLRRMTTGGPHQVLVVDKTLAELGPYATLETRPLSVKAGDMVGIRIDRGGLSSTPPTEIKADSPTGGVGIAIEHYGNGQPGSASRVHVNIVLEPLLGGTLDHRTVNITDVRGNRLLTVRIPLADGGVLDRMAPSGGPAPAIAAPFTEADSDDGQNHVIAPGQRFVVVLKDTSASTGQRWADRLTTNTNFEIEKVESFPGSGVGGTGTRVYRMRLKESTPPGYTNLAIYRMAPGESFETRSTRGDGSGPEFYLNVMVPESRPGKAHQIRAS